MSDGQVLEHELHGRTHVGGPAQVHELTRLTISKLAVGPMDNNCYLLRCRETGEQLLIDAAAGPSASWI